MKKANKKGIEFTRFSGMKKYVENILDCRFYIKGARDCATTKKVLASTGAEFGPDTCYWDNWENLRDGTYYVPGD